MKSIYKFYVLAIVLLFCIVTSTLAHSGGHYHKNDGTSFNTWILNNGKSISGNFAMGNSTYILLEKEEGEMIKLPMSSLSLQAQKMARFKIKQFDAFNSYFLDISNAIVPKTRVNYFYILLCVFLFSAIIYFIIIGGKVLLLDNPYSLKTMYKPAFLYVPLIVVLAIACKKSSDNITTTVIPKSTVTFIDSAFTPYKPAIGTNSDANYFYVSSNGIPSHNMMVGITTWQQQVPIPQFYTGANSWSIPLQPVYATKPLSTKSNFMKGAIAIAVNGIPIFNALNNRGEDAFLIGELDNWGGHCGKGDDYHYHAAPLHLSGTSGLKPIAFALDGFAVYGTKEADGTSMATLDTCHGHVVNTGVYHYHGTSNYPYVVGAMRGNVSTDPSTAAPENQILPQAFSSPLRPSTIPLAGASITAYASTGTNAYRLTYQIGTKTAFINYNWDATNKYTFTFIDINGVVTSSIYQRK